MKAKVSSLTVLLGILATLPHCGSSGDDSATGGSGGTTTGGSAGAAAGGKGGSSAGTTSEAGKGGTTTTEGGTGGTSEAGTGGTTPVGEGGEAGAETASVTLKGVVTGVAFAPGSPTEPTINVGYYQGATVCVDTNTNGKCDASEPSTTTSATGAFTLSVPSAAALIADIGTSATNTASAKANPSRNVFRASLAQVTEAPQSVVLSAMSTEVVRLTEANQSAYLVEKQNLASRIGVGVATVRTEDVLADVNTLTGGTKSVVARESNVLTNRFQYAITKLDRGDKFPDLLALPNSNATDTRPAITFAQAEQAAFNIEAVPRYDHIFIIMLENKSTQAILGSKFAPKINGYLTAGNQAASYYATGNPSEPNYTALGGADDFGITDDSQWNCDATGANAPTDLPLPDNTQPGLAKSPFSATCTQAAAVNHNIVGKPNLFTAITSAGMTWRTYSESMNPGQDFRTDSVADPAVKAQDHVYAPGTLAGNTTAVGDANLILPMPAGLYKTKHHPGMAYQSVRSEPDFKYSNRTLGGGQWDNALMNSSAYAIPAGYDTDQLGTDLETGNVGNLNFLVPDQCDDMHSITVNGTEVGSAATGVASDCSGVVGGNNVNVDVGGNIITRGDNYVDYLVKKIQTSDIWKNPQKRVAIVMMFDEGSAIAPEINSCCGWKAGKTATNFPLVPGTNAQDTTVNNYSAGNQGHGVSIFGVLNNQAAAPKKIVDTDSYSHFSFVRTLQDMFGLADPAVDASYMNRSKYTEKYIAQNIANLPEFAGSADTHFDAVRPMNHAYVIPAGYVAKTTGDLSLLRPAQTGPDANQTNIWALKP
jgi:hypothetical protein